jgi:hypothetical protein
MSSSVIEVFHSKGVGQFLGIFLTTRCKKSRVSGVRFQVSAKPLAAEAASLIGKETEKERTSDPSEAGNVEWKKMKNKCCGSIRFET